MRRVPEGKLLPQDKRASIAVDLGAESCRVSLLRWVAGRPEIQLVHRFANAPRVVNGVISRTKRGGGRDFANSIRSIATKPCRGGRS